MSFSEIDRINLVTKSLAAGVIDANSLSQWYETVFPFTFMLNADKILVELETIRQYPAGSIAQARTNAAQIPTLIQDLSQPLNAVRLTEVVDTNGTTWAAYETYGDYSSPVLGNWLQPQLVPQANGTPSNGYGILLYNGDPSTGAAPISTTRYISGAGANRSVSWFFNYSNGMLLLSEDFIAGEGAFDPYIVGFRYAGETSQDLKNSADILTEDLATLEASFAQHQIDTQAALNAIQAQLDNVSVDIGVSDVGSGISIGSSAGQTINLKTVIAGDHVTISEEPDGTLKISAEGGSRSGLIHRFVKGG